MSDPTATPPTGDPLVDGPAEARAAALAALLTPGVSEAEAEPVVTRTGHEVYAGGDVRRLLIRKASTLGYVTPGPNGLYQRAGAVPGDVVLLTQKQADRLDGLGVTVDADADLDEVAEELEETGYTDEQLAAMGAADLVAYVAQHPDEAPRVRELELAKRETKRRSSVLDATDPDVLAAAQVVAEAAAAAAEVTPAEGTGDGPTATEVAEGNQDNAGGGTGE